MALGWLYLYSRYRKSRREVRRREREDEWLEEICDSCGYPRSKHADDENETCPTYL